MGGSQNALEEGEGSKKGKRCVAGGLLMFGITIQLLRLIKY